MIRMRQRGDSASSGGGSATARRAALSSGANGKTTLKVVPRLGSLDTEISPPKDARIHTRAGRFCRKKRVENPRQLRLRNSAPSVGDFDDSGAVFAPGADHDFVVRRLTHYRLGCIHDQ